MWSPAHSAAHDLSQLPVAVQLAEDESGLGYVLRALRANGIAFDRGIEWLGIRRDKPLSLRTVRQLTWKLNTPPERLADRLVMEDPGGGADWVRLGGQRFSRDVATAKQYAKLCPQCVRSKGIARVSWLLRATVGCSEHGYSLITECSHCGVGVGWDRPDVDICRCGRPFCNQGKRPTLQPRLQAWQRWLDRSLCKSVSGHALDQVDARLPPAVQRLSLDGAFRLAEALGLFERAMSSTRSVRAQCQTFEQLGDVLDRGLERLELLSADPGAVTVVGPLANHAELLRVAGDPGTAEDQVLAAWLLHGMRGESGMRVSGRVGSRPKGQLPLFLVR